MVPLPSRLLLIVNPASGIPSESPAQLTAILAEMHAHQMIPEVYLFEPPNENLAEVVQDALQRGIRLFVVSGGDGTIDSVAGLLAGSDASLGIIPTGMQNNVALSLKIPSAIPQAVDLLRSGRPIQVDVGVAEVGAMQRPFLEVCSVGLLSALFPAADDIQHGMITRIGDLLATLVSSPSAQLHLLLNEDTRVDASGHVVMVTNMPYIGPHYRIGSETLMLDGTLETLIFANLSKLDLIGEMVQIAAGGLEGDERIQRYAVHQVEITTDPPMPVLADGFTLGATPVKIFVKPHAVRMISGLEEG